MNARSEFDEDRERVADPSEHEEIPRGWRPDSETLEAISGKETETSKVTLERQEIHKSPEMLPEKESSSGMRPAHDTTRGVQVAGDAQERQRLESAFTRLEATESGKAIVEALEQHKAQIRFASLDSDTIAEAHYGTNEILINAANTDASPNVLAAHLAHEGTHLQMGKPQSGAEMLEQEYQCFKAQAEVWNAAKGSETDSQCEDVVALIARGAGEAKAEIWQLYGEEYFERWDKQ